MTGREEVLTAQAWQGLRARLGLAPDEPLPKKLGEYQTRMDHELGVINSMGFAPFGPGANGAIGWNGPLAVSPNGNGAMAQARSYRKRSRNDDGEQGDARRASSVDSVDRRRDSVERRSSVDRASSLGVAASDRPTRT